MNKWKSIIIKLSDHYADFENKSVQRKLSAYATMKGHPGWNVHVEMLMLLRGLVAEEILSKNFTNLDATEKDIQQRAYSMVEELIMFLINPLKKAEERAKFIRGFNREMTNRK
jgi:hypothetical protein